MADQRSTNKRPGHVILWVTPRSVSTAFVKCMSGIPDSDIWFEPYSYGHFAASHLKTTDNIDLPMEYEGNEHLFGRAADIMSPIFDTKISPERLPYSTIKNGLETSTSKYVFVKDHCIAMAFHHPRQYLPVGYNHCFLIRHPDLVYASFHKAGYQQALQVGMLLEGEVDERSFDMRKHEEVLIPSRFYQDQCDLWKYIRANIDPIPIIIDSDDLLMKPAETLSKYCEATGMPYSDSLLKWDGSIESGMRWKFPGDDLIYNQSFMGVAMTSTHFTPPRKPLPRDQLTDDVVDLANIAMPFYQEMYESRIGALS